MSKHGLTHAVLLRTSDADLSTMLAKTLELRAALRGRRRMGCYKICSMTCTHRRLCHGVDCVAMPRPSAADLGNTKTVERVALNRIAFGDIGAERSRQVAQEALAGKFIR